MSDPILAVSNALAQLLDDPTIDALGVAADSIHWPHAPDTRTWPYILLDCIDAPDRDGTFTERTWSPHIWAIRTVTIADAVLASQIAAAADALLEGATFNIAGYRNLCCMRRRAIPPRPVQGDDNIVRIHGGGEYTIGVGEPA